MKTLGITALVPPELVYGCGWRPMDLNNIVPQSDLSLRYKLCAWTATWREALQQKRASVDALAVVAGGDCHNALVDGQIAASSGLPTHYFFYPFHGEQGLVRDQLRSLSAFLGEEYDPGRAGEVAELKLEAKALDDSRVDGKLPSEAAFQLLITASDLSGDLDIFRKELALAREAAGDAANVPRLALLGVPPIYHDFHLAVEDLAMRVVYDELPHEFVRLGGGTLDEMAASYSDYTFAREMGHRLAFLEKELERRKIDGVVHYTQYACHHSLEDEMLRETLSYPTLTIQGDLPGPTPQSVKFRLEAFSELLGRR